MPGTRKKSSSLSRLCTSPGVSIFARREIGESPLSLRAVILPYEPERPRLVHESTVCVERKDTAGHGHHWWANPHRVRQRQTGQHRDGTGRDGTGQDRLSLGIRTVNPGFYSPGIEVYSVLSRPRYVCAIPLRVHVPELCPTIVRQDVCISPLLDTVLAGEGEGRAGKPPSPSSLSSSLPPPFAAISCSLNRRRFLRSVRHPPPLCPRNEIFVKNARFILTSSPDNPTAPPYHSPRSPSSCRVLTGCPANWIYRTVPLYRTPPLNVSLN